MIKNIEKLTAEIAKTNMKIADYTNRLRDLERWKREAENAEIVAAVRGMEVSPDALKAFIDSCRQQYAVKEDNPENET